MAIPALGIKRLEDDLPNTDDDSGGNSPSTSDTTKPQSKIARRKASDGDFKYNCEWIGCNHIASGMNEFNHHVSLHRRGYTLCLGRDHEIGSAEFRFYCQWQDCNAQIEGQVDDFSRHVFYHTFHQYLKYLGQHVQTVEKLDKCLLDTASRNIIPELPEKLMCRWHDCGAVYENPYIFYSHASQHFEDYPKGNDPGVVVRCKWEGCSAVTKSAHKLKEHIRSHTQAKVIACPTCGSLFASNTRFIDHLKRQNQEPELNFECSHCNNRFASERILREHMRHHVNHYKCPLCDMTCHSPSAVRDHVRYRHSQERSFQCPQCDYKAKSATDLRRHSLSHVTKEAYSCTRPDCEKVFKTKKELMEHYSTDHEDYECHICSKPFEVHNYRWPSGHKRFRYKLHEDGVRRLQTIRYESIEVSQQVLGQDLSAQSVTANGEDDDENNALIIETGSCHGDKSSTDFRDLPDASKECAEFRSQEIAVSRTEDFEYLKEDAGGSRNASAVSLAVKRKGPDDGAVLKNLAVSGEGPEDGAGPKNKRKLKETQGNTAKSKGGCKKPVKESSVVSEASNVGDASNSQQDTVKARRQARKKKKKGDSQELPAELKQTGVDETNKTWLEVFYVDLDMK
ncbi:unnamed protein product [Candidula unifasciata]|uniref:C2H2-type domain-containing protein n=1 Tax=Candidula unifasciata TaxID=100452 RepID=A0A8S3YP69_9EUPU|nr:unnamed protein product [Candidula unifasciata]